jgi:Fe2+ or Zn2+ uptake regulation protein
MLTPQQFTDIVKTRFTQNDWRVTAGVKNILKFLIPTKTPLSAQELKNLVEDDGKRIDLATVYRILERLIYIQLVHRVIGKFMPTSDPSRDQESEHFLICEKTGQAVSIFLNYHNDIAQQLEQEKGFKLRHTDITFFGEF